MLQTGSFKKAEEEVSFKKSSLSELQIILLFMITEDNHSFLSSHFMQKKPRNHKITVSWKITFFYLKQIAGTYRIAKLQKAK